MVLGDKSVEKLKKIAKFKEDFEKSFCFYCLIKLFWQEEDIKPEKRH